MAAGKKRNLTPQDRARRSALMRELNESRKTGGHWGKLGGRPRDGESKEAALQRRRAEFAEAQEVARSAKQPVLITRAQKAAESELSDTEQQIRRVFAKSEKRGYASAIPGNGGSWYL